MERSYEQSDARKQAERVLRQHGGLVQCERCGTYVRQKHYERHVKSAKCYMASLRKRMYASGWVQASLTGCMNYKFFRDIGLLRMEATRMPPGMTAAELLERVGATEEQQALWIIAGDDRTFRSGFGSSTTSARGGRKIRRCTSRRTIGASCCVILKRPRRPFAWQPRRWMRSS